MRTLAIAALAAVAQGVPLQLGAGGNCDPDYECKFTHADKYGVLYEFDFAPLCSKYGYTAMDVQNHTYHFNICGQAFQQCAPKGYTSRYQYGAAIQFWGDTPICNNTAPECRTGPNHDQPTCCTANCEVLGVGTPVWTFQDPSNPATGGLMLTYQGVPPDGDDTNKCDFNPKTGVQDSRSITFIVNCDPTLPEPDDVEIDDIYENTTCHYVMSLRTGLACGCAPDCNGKTCGPDGCGGYCSGDSLQGGCPNGQSCQADNTCCRRDCTNRDCGSDGCGGSCGTCGDNEVCSSANVCMSTDPYIPTAPIQYYTNSGGLAGAYFGGILSTVAVAGAFMFFTGTGRSHFDRLRTGGFSALATSTEEGASKSLVGGSSGSSSGGFSSKFGGYGSTSAPSTAAASSGSGSSSTTDL